MSNDKLRELSEKATLGPWEANHYEFNYELWFLEHRNVPNYPNLKPTIAAMNGPCMAYANARNDAAFIVACVNHVREVLAQPVPAPVDELRALLVKWRHRASDAGENAIIDEEFEQGNYAAQHANETCADELEAAIAAQPVPAEGAQGVEAYPGQAYVHEHNKNIKRAEDNWQARPATAAPAGTKI